jgi:NitT/TauT family transport system substrate-binding protein
MSILLVLSLLMGCAPQAAPEPASPTEASAQPEPAAPDKIKVSVLSFLSFAPLFIAREEGYFAAQNLEVEFVNIESSQENVTALLSGQTDVMIGFITVGLINAMANNVNMQIVADKGYLDTNGCVSAALLARSAIVDESGALTLTDEERAKAVATYGQTTIHDYFFDTIMSPLGMDSNVVKSLQLPYNEIPAAFESSSLDMAMIAEPWTTRVLNTESAKLFRDLKVEFPDAQYSTMLYGPSLLGENPDAGKRFMTAYLQGVKQYQEGPTDRNIEIVNKYTKLDPAELKTLCWQSIHADGAINTQTIVEFQEWAVSEGYLEAAIPVETFWNPAFIEYAQTQIQ